MRRQVLHSLVGSLAAEQLKASLSKAVFLFFLLRLSSHIATMAQDFLCPLEFCDESFVYPGKFIAHIKQHMKYGFSVVCPFENCSKSYSNVSSFSTHLNRKHPHGYDRLNSERTLGPSVNAGEQLMDIHSDLPITVSLNDVTSTTISTSNNSTVFASSSSHTAPVTVSSESDLNATGIAALLCLLQHKQLIPSSTIDTIVSETVDMLNSFSAHVKEKLKLLLERNLIDHDVVQEIVKDLTEDLSLTDVFSCLNTEYLRKQYIRNNFMFVSPISKKFPLHGDIGETVTYMYVPLLESLKAIFSDAYVKEQFLADYEQSTMYGDFGDGLKVKNNDLFKLKERSLKLLLYTDAFEIVNPLGSARCKYKILVVYYTLANFHVHNRSNLDPFQLLLLCPDKYINTDSIKIVMRPLVNDIKALESSGIDLGVGTLVRGSVLCILGDNLGSHLIGGFSTNFGSMNYMCRFCTITKNEILHNCLSERPLQTPQNYSCAVQDVDHQNCCMGIKQSSIFNELKFFHVCDPGLPSCIGHDVFEGVVQYDMILYVKYLLKIISLLLNI